VASTGIGPAFGGDPASARSEELIQFLDACRQVDVLAQGKQWSFERLGLRTGQSVLDVGCGTGDDVAAMAGAVGPSGRAVGVDSSEGMISEAVSRHGGLPGVSFDVGDAHRLPFESESFDGCRSERVLQHVDDPDRSVREMARVLKRGGRLALIDADWDAMVIEGADPAVSGAIWRNQFAGIKQPHVGRRLQTLLVQNGFLELNHEVAAALLTDFDYAARIFDFAHAASEAVEGGIVSRQAALRWLDDLQNAGRDKRFFCAIPNFRAAGQKP
jgi:ubiquinone/menaquinone biosynthesis C-methylase UbiE